MTLDVELGQRVAQTRTARLGRDRIDRNDLAMPAASRATREVDLDRRGHLARTECRSRRTAAQQDLVDVVMEDGAEAFEVVPAELDADPLGDRIAERVGMPSALALDDLDLARVGLALRVDTELHHTPRTPITT